MSNIITLLPHNNCLVECVAKINEHNLDFMKTGHSEAHWTTILYLFTIHFKIESIQMKLPAATKLASPWDTPLIQKLALLSMDLWNWNFNISWFHYMDIPHFPNSKIVSCLPFFVYYFVLSAFNTCIWIQKVFSVLVRIVGYHTSCFSLFSFFTFVISVFTTP